MKQALVTTLTGLLVTVASIVASAQCALAQELEPRSFANTPVGLNFLLASYGYTNGNVVFSAASPVTDAEVQTHAGILAYVRSLDVGGLSGKVGIIVPYAGASGSAQLAGQPGSAKCLASPTLGSGSPSTFSGLQRSRWKNSPTTSRI